MMWHSYVSARESNIQVLIQNFLMLWCLEANSRYEPEGTYVIQDLCPPRFPQAKQTPAEPICAERDVLSWSLRTLHYCFFLPSVAYFFFPKRYQVLSRLIPLQLYPFDIKKLLILTLKGLNIYFLNSSIEHLKLMHLYLGLGIDTDSDSIQFTSYSFDLVRFCF